MAKILTTWTITPPPGLTKGGRAHTFHARTVEKLRLIAEQHVDDAFDKILGQWDDVYPYGEGKLPNSLRRDIRAGPKGVQAKILIGNFKHLRYISVLGGEYKAGPYRIEPDPDKEKRFLRFKDARTGEIVYARYVIHPGFGGRDLLAEVISEEGELFRLDAILAVSNSILELNTPGMGSSTQTLRRR